MEREWPSLFCSFTQQLSRRGQPLEGPTSLTRTSPKEISLKDTNISIVIRALTRALDAWDRVLSNQVWLWNTVANAPFVTGRGTSRGKQNGLITIHVPDALARGGFRFSALRTDVILC